MSDHRRGRTGSLDHDCCPTEESQSVFSVMLPAALDRVHITDLHSGMQLARVPPDLDESLDGPSHQIGNLFIA
jgi:hypothetical protein